MRNSIGKLQPVDGMEKALSVLQKQGYPMGIVTSNDRDNVLLFLKNNNLDTYFQCIYTGRSLFGKDKYLNVCSVSTACQLKTQST